jgi:hypothetical protein
MTTDYTMSISLRSAAPSDNGATQYFHAQVAIAKDNCCRRWKSIFGNSSKRISRNTRHQQTKRVQASLAGGDVERDFNLVRVRKLVIKKEEAKVGGSNADNEGIYEEFPPKTLEHSLFSTLPEVCEGARGVDCYSELPEVVEPVLLEASTVACSPAAKKSDSTVRYFTSKWGGIRKLGLSNKGKELIASKATLEKYEEPLTTEQIVAFEKRALLQDLTDPRGE